MDQENVLHGEAGEYQAVHAGRFDLLETIVSLPQVVANFQADFENIDVIFVTTISQEPMSSPRWFIAELHHAIPTIPSIQL